MPSVSPSVAFTDRRESSPHTGRVAGCHTRATHFSQAPHLTAARDLSGANARAMHCFRQALSSPCCTRFGKLQWATATRCWYADQRTQLDLHTKGELSHGPWSSRVVTFPFVRGSALATVIKTNLCDGGISSGRKGSFFRTCTTSGHQSRRREAEPAATAAAPVSSRILSMTIVHGADIRALDDHMCFG